MSWLHKAVKPIGHEGIQVALFDFFSLQLLIISGPRKIYMRPPFTCIDSAVLFVEASVPCYLITACFGDAEPSKCGAGSGTTERC